MILLPIGCGEFLAFTRDPVLGTIPPHMQTWGSLVG